MTVSCGVRCPHVIPLNRGVDSPQSTPLTSAVEYGDSTAPFDAAVMVQTMTAMEYRVR